MKNLENQITNKIVSEKIKEIENEKWIVLRYWKIENVVYCKSEWEYSELRNNVYNNTNLWTCEMIITKNYIYYLEKEKFYSWIKPIADALNISAHEYREQYLKWLVNFEAKRICESCSNILKLENDTSQFVLYFLGNYVKVYINNSFFNAMNVYPCLKQVATDETISRNKSIYLGENNTFNTNIDFQEFLVKIINFEEECFERIEYAEEDLRLENPIIEKDTLFMAIWTMNDMEDSIKKCESKLREFDQFDLNQDEIVKAYYKLKYTLQELQNTYDKIKRKYGPAISTYKTLRKITSKNAVYKPSEINYDDTANTENNVKAQDNKKDDSDENSTLTTEIWVILIIIWIIILIALNS